MKKWLDDLHAILLRRGFITLDNVLKKYKTQIEDYEEVKISSEIIRISPDETYTIDISNYFNVYDRFMIYNRGVTSDYGFIAYFYKYNDNQSYMYTTQNSFGGTYSISTQNNRRYFDIKNISSSVLQFDLYAKKYL